MVFTRNGGVWAFDQWKNDEHEMRKHALELWDAPFALEIKTPNGHTIGLVHASVPENDWGRMSIIDRSWGKHYVKLDDVNDRCLWSRNHIDKLLRTGTTDEIKNIEHVFFGHTPVAVPITHKNCTWIDTKAFKSGILTILDADEFLESVQV
jgi:serine/threonine protein phosphatase 1